MKAPGKAGVLVWSLGVVGVFVVLLAAVAGPKFVTFSCRSRQSEAKALLRELARAEDAFRSERKRFTADLGELALPARDARSHYVVGFAGGLGAPHHRLGEALRTPAIDAIVATATAHATGFKAYAVGDIGRESLDVWTIDQDGVMSNPINACASR